MTRSQRVKRREYWKVKKREQRANMSAQKKRRINEKKRQLYSDKKQQSQQKTLLKMLSRDNIGGYKTDSAKRKAVYRAKNYLPSSPNKYADVVVELVKKATPRKRKALNTKNLILTPTKRQKLEFYNSSIEKIKKALNDSKRHSEKLALRRRRILASSIASSLTSKNKMKEFGFSWSFAVKSSQMEGLWADQRKTRSDALDISTLQQVEEFYKNPRNAVCMPDKKLDKKTMEPLRVMQNSLKDAFSEFRTNNPDCVLGFSKFAALRPRSVKTMDKNHFNNCLCEYCTNAELKVKALNKVAPAKTFIQNRYDMSKITLCPKPEGSKFHRKECIERSCDFCGTKLLMQKIRSQIKNRKQIEWNKWESQSYTDSKGNKKVRKMLQLKKGSVNTFLNELNSEITTFSGHLHNAMWQYDQFCSITKEVPQKWVVFCMDFAENYTCLYQDEAHSAHWSHNQVTLFSIVAYYRCQTCDRTMHESLVYITDDKKHDSHAVQCFVQEANRHLVEKRKLAISKEVHFSDGAASQFKSKTPFADVAYSKDDFGFPVEKHFFGSRHGKGPCDGEFGVIKRTASNAVSSRKALIRNTEEFFQFAKKELSKPKDDNAECCHSRRTCFFIKDGIVRNRPDRVNVRTVPETRKLHAVKPEEENSIATRTLSCFCNFCIHGEGGGECVSSQHLSGWKSQKRHERGKQGHEKKSTCNTRGARGNKVTNITRKGKVMDPEYIPPKEKKTNYTPERKGNKGTNINRKGKVMDPEYIPPKEKKTNYTPERKSDEHLQAQNEDLEDSDFQTLYRSILLSKDFSELEKKVLEVFENIPRLPEPGEITFTSHKLKIDKASLTLVPETMQEMYPTAIYGDGNCLPLAHGTEEHHIEMRIRIIIELVLNQEQYLQDSYLKSGGNLRKNIAKRFAMFSEYYTTQVLTDSIVKEIFQAEVMGIRQSGCYMGVWQMAALANILQRTVVSVYPMYGGKTVKEDLDRKFVPFNYDKELSLPPVYIMWTHLQGKNIAESLWRPNHFVVLLKRHKEQVPEEFSETSDNSFLLLYTPTAFDEEDHNTSIELNNSFLDTILEELEDLSEVDSDKLMHNECVLGSPVLYVESVIPHPETSQPADEVSVFDESINHAAPTVTIASSTPQAEGDVETAVIKPMFDESIHHAAPTETIASSTPQAEGDVETADIKPMLWKTGHMFIFLLKKESFGWTALCPTQCWSQISSENWRSLVYILWDPEFYIHSLIS